MTQPSFQCFRCGYLIEVPLHYSRATINCPSCREVIALAAGQQFSPGHNAALAQPPLHQPVHPGQTAYPYQHPAPDHPAPSRRVPWWAIAGGAFLVVALVVAGALVVIMLPGERPAEPIPVNGPPAQNPVPPHSQWVRYVSEEDGYEALFPTTPGTRNMSAGTPHGHLPVYRAQSALGSTSFEIAHYQSPAIKAGSDYLEGIHHYARALHTPATEIADWTCSGIGGKRAKIKGQHGTRALIAHIAVRDRVYTLIQENPPTESTADFDYFLRNLKLAEIRTKGPPLSAQAFPSTPRVFELPIEITVAASGGSPPYTPTLISPGDDSLRVEADSAFFRIRGRLAQPGTTTIRGTVRDAAGATVEFSATVEALPMPETVGKLVVSPKQGGTSMLYESPRVELFPLEPYSAHIQFDPEVPATEVLEWTCTPGELPVGFEFEDTGSGAALLKCRPLKVGTTRVTVHCRARIKDTQRVYEHSVEFEVVALPLEPNYVPEVPGGIGSKVVLQRAKYTVVECWFSAVAQDYGGAWPCEVTWDWNEDHITKGVAISVDQDGKLRLEATDSEPGGYALPLTCTVKLAFVEKPYVLKYQLRYDVP